MDLIHRNLSLCSDCSTPPSPDEVGNQFGPGGILLLDDYPHTGGWQGMYYHILGKIGAHQEWFYHTHVVPHVPYGDSAHTKVEREFHRTNLDATLKAERPGIILALGGTAAQFLINKTGIKYRRGQLEMYNKVPLLLTYDMGYLLGAREKSAESDVANDFVKACQYAQEFADSAKPEQNFGGI